MAGYELATAYVNLVVETGSVAKQIGGTFKGVEGAAGKTGTAAGKTFRKAFDAQEPIDLKRDAEKAAAQVQVASKKVQTEREKEQAATRKVQIEEAKLSELRASGNAKTSQLLTAEDRLARAKQSAALASERVESAVQQEAAAKQRSDQANDRLIASQRRAGDAAQGTAQQFTTMRERVQAALRGDFKGAFARVPKDADSAADKVEDRFDEAGRESGSAFSEGMKKAAGALAIYFSFDALKDGFQSVMEETGNLEQSVGAIGSVFKDSAADMLAWSDSAATTVGLSKNEYNELGTLLGAQLKNAGTAMDELAPKTNDLIGLGSDLASMFGGTTREAVESISSALKGERDPIEKYGVSLKQASIDAKAAELGFTKVGGSFDQEAQAAATLALIMEQTTDAHGNFARETDTLANRQQVAAAQWDNLKSRIGEAFLPAATAAMTFVTNRGIPALEGMVDKLKGLGTWVQNNSVWLKPLAFAIGGIAVAWGVYSAAQAIATAATAAWGAALKFALGPVNWIITGIGLLAAGLIWFFTQTEAGKALWSTIWSGMQDAVAAVVNWWQTTAMPIWDTTIKALGSFFTWLWTSVIQPAWNGIATVIGWAWNNVIKPIWAGIQWYIKSILVPYFQFLWGVVQFVWNAIQAAISFAWNNIIKPIWTAIQWYINSVLVPVFRLIQRVVQIAWSVIQSVISVAWKAIIKPVWDAIVGFINNWLVPRFRFLQAVVSAVWAQVRAAIGTAWNWIRANVFQPIVTWITNNIVPRFEYLRSRVTEIWTGIKDRLWSVWNTIKAKVFDPLSDVVRNKVPDAFSKGRDAIGKAWDGLKAIARKPVAFVVESIVRDGIVKAWNKIADTFSAKKINTKLFTVPQFARGGWTGPGSRFKEAGIVHADEFVISKPARRKFERRNPGVLDHINRTGELPMYGGYASGGRVGKGTLWDAAQWWISRGARASRHSWFNGGRRITSGHSRNSYHYRDLAVDFNYGPGGTNATEQAFFDRHIGEFQRAFPGIRTIWRAPGHYNHLHIDTSRGANMGGGGGGGGGGDLPGLLKPFKGLFDKIRKGITTAGDFGQMIGSGARKIVQMPIDWITNKASEIWETGKEFVKDTVAKARGRAWALRNGVPWGPLNYIVSRESGWDPKAKNPRSTAAGLPQFIEANQRHYGVYPIRDHSIEDQLNAMNRYVKDRFGGWYKARDYWSRNRHYWTGGHVVPTKYDKGGVLMPGTQLVTNQTRRPEYILPARATESLMDGEFGTGGGNVYDVKIYANSNADGRKLAKEFLGEIRRQERGGRYASV